MESDLEGSAPLPVGQRRHSIPPDDADDEPDAYALPPRRGAWPIWTRGVHARAW